MNGAKPGDPAAMALNLLKRGKAGDIDPSWFYTRIGVDAVRHLFRVAAGLDSMILGEAQILGQVKEAFRLACAAHTNGFLMNRLMHTSFRVGSRARSETEIGTGAVSVSLAAVELSRKIFRDLAKKRALVIGAGEMAVLTAEHFAAKNIGGMTFINRTMSKAEALAARFGGGAMPWESLSKAIAASDVVIASTRSPNIIVTSDMVRAAMEARRNQPVFLIDIAIPRNIDPAAGKLYNVFAHNIDDLKNIIDHNLHRRRLEVPKVEAIIEEEIKKFMDWHRSLSAAPTIKSLVDRAENIRLNEMKKSEKHFSPEQRAHLDSLTRGIVNKLLHPPISKIKEATDTTEESLYRIEAVQDMFDLKDIPDTDEKV
jgi:glutamyl-tRNA reductase